VSIGQDTSNLSDRRYVTVVLRLLLDKRGRLIHGELVDTAGALQERFVGWRGLLRAVKTWLMQQEQKGTAGSQN